MARLIHHRNKCIGCSYCVEIAPDFWEMNDEDGRCDLIGSQKHGQLYVLEIFTDDLPISEKVVKLCPVNCIKTVSS